MKSINNKNPETLYNELPLKSFEETMELFKEKHSVLKNRFESGNIPEHLKGLDIEMALLKVTGPPYIDSILGIGIYRSLSENSMELLNDSLFTYNRLNYHRSLLISSDVDHSRFFEQVLESFAANDLPLIQKIFCEEKGLCSEGNRFACTGSNLIISLMHDNREWREKALKGVENFLIKKNNKSDNAFISYLAALHNNEPRKAGKLLGELSSLYQKIKWIHDFKSPFLKIFSPVLHGLYNMAYHYLPGKSFSNIELPEAPHFLIDFTRFNMENGFSPGKPAMNFKEELEGMNRFFII
ncbi:MAG TPA: hypothetical protein PK358_01190 [Spirochaetota bacterium]|nr:hypothetical protein [Spirochaetota bacterium]HPJ33415.1 hypothetical protein [Spirochaetota bacterium]